MAINSKRLKKISVGNVFISGGYNLVSGTYTEITPSDVSVVADDSLQSLFLSSDVLFNDGTLDYTGQEGFDRFRDKRYTDVLHVSDLLDNRSQRWQLTTNVTSVGTITLTSTSTYIQTLTGTTSGQIVKLPNATTLLAGHSFLIHNGSSQIITIQDNGSNTLLTLDSDHRVIALVNDNSSSNGVWLFTISLRDPGVLLNLIGSTSRFNDFDQIDFHQHHTFHFIDVEANGGTVAIFDSAPDDNSYMGWVLLGTGTTFNSTGRAILDGNGSVNNIKMASMSCEWRVKVPVLSTGTVGFQLRIGILDRNTAGDPANGIFFYYSNTENSGKWRAVSRNSSTSTIVESNVTVSADTWYRVRFSSTSQGNSVNFFIDDVYIGTATTNIPVSNETRVMAKLEKKSPSTSSTRTVLIDYLSFGVER